MCTELLISALSGIFGAFVGSWASYKAVEKQLKFTAEQEHKKEVREDKLYIQRKREETYCMVLRTYFELNKSRNFPNYKTDLDKFFADLYPYVNIYTSKKIKDIYNKVAHQKAMEDDLIDAIREELKIPN